MSLENFSELESSNFSYSPEPDFVRLDVLETIHAMKHDLDFIQEQDSFVEVEEEVQTDSPTESPVSSPSIHPSYIPSSPPSILSSVAPSRSPTIVSTVITNSPSSRAPTRTPSLRPSAAPTVLRNTLLSFNANITLSSLNVSLLTDNGKNVIATTVAQSLNISVNNVKILGATRSPSSSSSSARRLSSSSSDAIILTKIQYLLGTTTNATKVYNYLKSTLTEMVTVGNFSTLLQQNARLESAFELFSSVASSVSVSAAAVQYPTSTDTSSSSSSSTLDSGAIAGIVIGVVFFVSIAIGMGFVCFSKKREDRKDYIRVAPAP